MNRLYLVRDVVRPRPEQRSAKVIELSVRRKAREERRKPQPPASPAAA